MKQSLYDFSATSLKGEEISFKKYEGKVVLVTNIATRCGLAFQMKRLEKLYTQFKDKGLVILGFPSDDFGHQNPESNADTHTICMVNFGVSFPILQKINIKAPPVHPLYNFLTHRSQNGKFSYPVLWNFQKYLFDTQGKLRHVYFPIVYPDSWLVKHHVKSLLSP